MSLNIGQIADTSTRAVCSMLVVLVVGILFAYFKKIDMQGLSSVGQAISYLYVPAILFYSFAKGLSVDVFEGGGWMLIVLGAVTMPLSTLMAYPFMRVGQTPDWFQRWFLFGCTFQNTVAMPLVLIQTICSQIDFAKSNTTTNEFLTSEECIAKAQTYLFLYIFVNGLMFWVVAYDIMPSKFDKTVEPTTTATTDAEVATSIEIREAEAVVLEEETSPSLLKRMRWLIIHVASLCLRPPIIAQLVGTLVGLVPALQDLFFAPNAYLSPLTVCVKIFADASTAVTNLSMACSLGLQICQLTSMRHLFGGDARGLSIRTTAAFVLCRMLAIPGGLFACIYGMSQLGWFPAHDRLLLLTAYMVSATPSANMCVVVPQLLGNHRASGALGLLLLGQYLVAIPSLLLWLSLAFYLTSP
ncbi:hypothetical protein BASA81_007835 [Batrachochytrium salamandrivorans]|nr:hypothetical protein BASA81_007835 [Batrachochytrium salamandrivorans]